MDVLHFLIHDIDDTTLWTTPLSADPCSISSISAASNESSSSSSSSSSLASPSQQLREGHWLWSFGAQLDWQHRSGRLLSVTTNPGCVIGAAPAVADPIYLKGRGLRTKTVSRFPEYSVCYCYFLAKTKSILTM